MQDLATQPGSGKSQLRVQEPAKGARARQHQSRGTLQLCSTGCFASGADVLPLVGMLPTFKTVKKEAKRCCSCTCMVGM